MLKNKKSLIAWSALGIIGLAVFILFFNHAFPTASIDIKLSKQEVFKKAEAFILAHDFDLTGYQKAIKFDSDDDASIYLQKTQGMKRTNELIRKEIPVWYWKVRWFKELQKEGFWVFIDPSTGEVVQFYHPVPEDEKGADLTKDQARAIADETCSYQGVDLRQYELKDSSAKKQKQRTDYHFGWEKKDYKIKQATLRLDVHIYGDRLGGYARYLKVPETFLRTLEKEMSIGAMLSMISTICVFLFMVGTIFVLIVQHKQNKVNWGFGIFFATIVALLTVIYFLNSFPLLWINYPDTISKAVFIILSLGTVLISAILIWLTVFLYGTSGESLSRDLWQTKIPIFTAVKNRDFSNLSISSILTVGYSLGFISLGYITLFYLIGTRFFNIWMPPNAKYSDILGTAMPFLFPLTIAVTAAISEEFTFRLFTISFFKKYIKSIWLAVLIPALVWAFGHSQYLIFPSYVRGIELTLFGVVLGVVFLKYGLETVIISHFVIDASLVGLPLLRSHSPYFVISGLIVITSAFMPLIIISIIFKNKK